MQFVSAIAHTNIALIKYWGKAPGSTNLPATGSLSLTLDCFFTKTTLKNSHQDRFILNGIEQSGERLERIQAFLNLMRVKHVACEIISENHVPTQSGLASSASGFAALACAANKFFELGLDSRGLSELARQGSGSAARSIFPGLVLMHLEGYAESLESPELDLNLLVVHCSNTEKQIDSRTAMNKTAETSPYYSAWVGSHAADLLEASKAILNSDFQKLGELTEYSTLKMHASMMASRPGIWYFESMSMAVMNAVRDLRRQGIEAYFTLDAGPHVKILCQSQNIGILTRELQKISGIQKIQHAKPGPGAYLL
ncbi:MAG: diphosphomevalonate decarboxylase [Myxococcaceae bacterium]